MKLVVRLLLLAGLSLPGLAHAQSTIGGLQSVTQPALTDVVPLTQGYTGPGTGATRKGTLQQIMQGMSLLSIQSGSPTGYVPVVPTANSTPVLYPVSSFGGGGGVPAAAQFLGSNGTQFLLSSFGPTLNYNSNVLNVIYGTTSGTAAQGNDSRLSQFTPSTPGIVPLSGGGTTTFLRADGAWAAPPSGGIAALTGDVTASGSGSVASTVTGINGTPVATSLATGALTATSGMITGSGGLTLGNGITSTLASSAYQGLIVTPAQQTPQTGVNTFTYGVNLAPTLAGPGSSASGYYAGIYSNLIETGTFGNWTTGDNLAIWDNLEVDGTGTLFAAKGIQTGISEQGTGSLTITNNNVFYGHVQMNNSTGTMTNLYGFQLYVSGTHTASITNLEDFNCQASTDTFVLSNRWCVRNDSTTAMNFSGGPMVQAGTAVFGSTISMIASPTAFTKTGLYPMVSITTPTITTGFGTGDAITSGQGTAGFQDTVGTSPSTSLVLAMSPAAKNGWVCQAHDLTHNGVYLDQSATTTTSVSFVSYNRATGIAAAPTAADVIAIGCSGM